MLVIKEGAEHGIISLSSHLITLKEGVVELGWVKHWDRVEQRDWNIALFLFTSPPTPTHTHKHTHTHTHTLSKRVGGGKGSDVASGKGWKSGGRDWCIRKEGGA